MASLTVLFPDEGESLSALLKRMQQTEGDVLLILGVLEDVLIRDTAAQKQFFDACAPLSGQLRLGLKKHTAIQAARRSGLRVIDRSADLRQLLEGHPRLQDALREFSPHVWRQQLRSRLQSMGLLSLPRLRIWLLIVTSAGLFFFVFFRLMPSATIQVWPREDTVSQTANIFLASSGAIANLPSKHVRILDLHPITVNVDHTLTFDQVSKEFMGTSSEVPMTVYNKSTEQYSLREGSRLINQAGMIFRIQEDVILHPHQEILVRAVADDLDLYGGIIGERGNVPSDLRWEFMGLSKQEQKLVYAENHVPGQGGVTAHRTVLSRSDLDNAKEKLRQELLAIAKQLTEERRELHNAQHGDKALEILYYDELTQTDFGEPNLSEEFLGEPVSSIPVRGALTHTVYAYDTQEVLEMLSDELRSHVSEGSRLLEESLALDRLVAHVIDYEDDLSWIKLTVDLSGTEQYILDPLSPTGAQFGRDIRQSVVGLTKSNAQRIVQNFPEVEKVVIRLWPPWTRTMPSIPSHIVIEPMTE